MLKNQRNRCIVKKQDKQKNIKMLKETRFSAVSKTHKCEEQNYMSNS